MSYDGSSFFAAKLPLARPPVVEIPKACLEAHLGMRTFVGLPETELPEGLLEIFQQMKQAEDELAKRHRVRCFVDLIYVVQTMLKRKVVECKHHSLAGGCGEGPYDASKGYSIAGRGPNFYSALKDSRRRMISACDRNGFVISVPFPQRSRWLIVRSPSQSPS